MSNGLICAHCGFAGSHFVLTLDDVMCATCAYSYHLSDESFNVRTCLVEELSVCGICESAYIKNEDQEHDLCSLICLQTQLDQLV